jgi:hypothetical protein
MGRGRARAGGHGRGLPHGRDLGGPRTGPPHARERLDPRGTTVRLCVRAAGRLLRRRVGRDPGVRRRRARRLRRSARCAMGHRPRRPGRAHVGRRRAAAVVSGRDTAGVSGPGPRALARRHRRRAGGRVRRRACRHPPVRSDRPPRGFRGSTAGKRVRRCRRSPLESVGRGRAAAVRPLRRSRRLRGGGRSTAGSGRPTARSGSWCWAARARRPRSGARRPGRRTRREREVRGE